ncbi:MAG: hypothetical protein A2Y10_14495 [Planctomycetes bacterium GWF2_41_51]|nr:MAG: hypothetical protein A2Y10_14495 [Planctomycetes bacterium GWF2_41_51]HBG25512.1 hypothetical protein [Phycisphaerales bacterium]
MPFDPPLSCEEIEAAFGELFKDVTLLPCGGQGAVFKCTHQPSNEVVALKIYYTDQVQQRTQREIDLMKRIDADAIVRLVVSGEIFIRNNKCIFMATRFIHGKVLSEVITQNKIEISVIAKCGHYIAKAIQLLWAERIVHRDINPKNIMLKNEGSAVLIDLGIARHIELEALTMPGCTWGTPGYFSPEQARAVRQLSYKSDIFALGITLQECLAGKHPVNRRQDLLLNGCPIKTNTIRNDIPQPMVKTIDSMVKFRAYDRPRIEEILKTFELFI